MHILSKYSGGNFYFFFILRLLKAAAGRHTTSINRSSDILEILYEKTVVFYFGTSAGTAGLSTGTRTEPAEAYIRHDQLHITATNGLPAA